MQPKQMIRQEHLWIVACEHDDSGQDSTTGRLPFELDGTSKRELDGPTPEAERLEKWFLADALNLDDLKGVMERGGIPERKFDFADGSACLDHVGVDILTGPLRAVLVQVRWSGDMQDQVRDGNEQTGRMEEPRFHYSWRFRRRRVRNRCLLGSLRGVGCRERCG